MILSDISVRRPVFATVLSLLLVAFGVLSFVGLPLRELPNIDPPVVSISTTYPGASAQVIEDTVTARSEQEMNGIERLLYMDRGIEKGVVVHGSVDGTPFSLARVVQ